MIDIIIGDLPEGYKTVKHPRKTITKNKLIRVAMNEDFDAKYKSYPGKIFILNGDYVYFTANIHQVMPSYHRYSLIAFYRSDYWFMVGDKFKLKVLQKLIPKVLVGKDNIVYDYFEILKKVG